MKNKGINLENVKIKNRSVILRIIINSGAMSRMDIARELSLTKGAVSLLCSNMIEEGLLVEKGEIYEMVRAGRRKILVDINSKHKYVISINIEIEKTYITICNLKGVKVHGIELKTLVNISAEEFLFQISKDCKIMMWELNILKENILGVGVCLPGLVNRHLGVSNHAYGIWKYEVEVGKLLEQFLEFTVIVENNVKAFAQGELVYGVGRKYDNLLFIKWGPGVGASIVINSELYEGKNHKAAEIGHYITEIDGELCHCGRSACLESKISNKAIAKKIEKIFSLENTPHLYAKLNGDMREIKSIIFSLWSNMEDINVKNILEDGIEELAKTVVNIMTLLAPDKVILFGTALDEEYIAKRFIDFCKEYVPSYNEETIKQSKLSNKINYIGPAAIVTKQLFFEKGGLS